MSWPRATTSPANTRTNIRCVRRSGWRRRRQAGKFKDEIIPVKTKMKKVNKETKEETIVDYTVTGDECNRPDTTLEGLAKLDAGARAGQVRHRRQCQPAFGRRGRRGADGSQGGREARAAAAGPVQGLGGRRLRAGRDGHRPGVRDSAPAGTPRAEDRRHRSVGAERSLRHRSASIAATRSASTRRSTTSTAARSRSAIPSA